MPHFVILKRIKSVKRRYNDFVRRILFEICFTRKTKFLGVERHLYKTEKNTFSNFAQSTQDTRNE